MNRLFAFFNAAARMHRNLSSAASHHAQKIHAGFQALESSGHSRNYHRAKIAGLGTLFVASVATYNVEGVIAVSMSIGDEINFLETLSKHSPKGPEV
ncbi:MAG: hypothetical protein AAF549_07020 [Pseudomonadota bacterium]